MAVGLLVLIIPAMATLFWYPVQPTQATPAQNNLVLNPPPPIPVRLAGTAEPILSAPSALVIDLDSASILFAKDQNAQLMPASTTKIMTALVAMKTYPLDKVITITDEDRSIGHSMNLVRGETITVENLLYGLLVASGNDAALALALSYPDNGYTGFVEAMNQTAKELNLNHTVYKNVSGVETPGHVTTVTDLSLLAKEAIKQPLFNQIVATEKNYRQKYRRSHGSFIKEYQSTPGWFRRCGGD